MMAMTQTLPEGMKELGFVLAQTQGNKTGQFLLLPQFPPNAYYPNVDGISGEGSFTSIEFDPMKNCVVVKTADGETGTLEIDVEKETVRMVTESRQKGQAESTSRLETDPRAAKWAASLFDERKNAPHFRYDAAASTLSRTQGGNIFSRETLKLPDGVTVETFADAPCFVRIKDVKGTFQEHIRGFTPMDGESYESDHFYLCSAGNQYFVDGRDSQTDSVSGLIKRLMKNSLERELRGNNAPVSTITVSGKSLCVFGPNRVSQYRLSSGKSGVMYDPVSGEIKPSGGWGCGPFMGPPVTAEVTEGSVADGVFFVLETHGRRSEGKYQLWRVDVDFNNTDPKKSYHTTLVESTVKES